MRRIFLIGIMLFMVMTKGNAMALNVEEAELFDVLRGLGKAGNLQLVLEGDIKGKVSLRTEEESPEKILNQLVKAGGLSLTKEGEVYIVASGKAINRGFGRVYVLPVYFAPLEGVRDAISLYFQQASYKEGTIGEEAKGNEEEKNGKSLPRVLIDINTGSILLYGTQEEAAEAEAIIRKMDIPAQQISIEAKLVAINSEDAKKLGIRWQWSEAPQYVYQEEKVNRGNLKGNSVPGGILSFGKGPGGHPYELQYSAGIDALISSGRAKLLSRPNILTLQGQEAVINIGGEVPVPEVSVTNSTTTTSIAYRPVGIILKCKPMVNKDGYITSAIHTEVSSPSYVEAMNAYSFQKRSADTMVRMKEGETLIIGGLISSEEINSQNKIPFLGDIPVLGKFFTSNSRSNNSSELVIMLKAHIIP